jgi:hypothetical protein
MPFASTTATSKSPCADPLIGDQPASAPGSLGCGMATPAIVGSSLTSITGSTRGAITIGFVDHQLDRDRAAASAADRLRIFVSIVTVADASVIALARTTVASAARCTGSVTISRTCRLIPLPAYSDPFGL